MTFDTFADTCECQEAPRLPCKSAWEPVFKTFENERFCSFPHRHGDATWKPENRDETCWSLRAQNKHFVWDFLRFSHFVATKSTFSYEFSQICYFKIDVSCETSVSFHHISQNPSLLPNLHVVTTWRSPDITTLKKNAQHDTSKVLRLPRKMSKVLRPPRKMQLIFWKRRKSIALVTQNDFGHVMKHALSIAYWLESINPSCKLLIWKKKTKIKTEILSNQLLFLLIFFIDLLIDLFFDYFIDFDFVFHSFFLMHVWLL